MTRARTALLLAVIVAACTPAARAQSGTFPESFHWGAATAAHQVEGDNVHADWWAFEQEPGTIHQGERSGAAVDHYRQFDGDFAAAAQMGHNAHRLSFEWARIEPEPGRYDEEALRHYDAVVASLQRHGLTPYVTLWHMTLPDWAAQKGGWLNPEVTTAYVRYVELVVSRYRDRVRHWITLNEPNVYGYYGYDRGIWPPRHHDRNEAVTVIVSLLKAHGKASKRIHAIDPLAKVGIANHLAVFVPMAWWNPFDHLKAAVVSGFNRLPLEAQTTGRLQLWMPGVRRLDEVVSDLKGSVDFIGVNYYTRWQQSMFDDREQVTIPGAVTNDLGWEYYPQGIYDVLLSLKPYHLPVVITENGTADKADRQRQALLVATLRHVQRAMADGIDVRGYFHWSLLDNFEWADGYKASFGLMAVDRDRPGMPRTWRPSAMLYRDIIRARSLPASDIAVVPSP
jgi:beta-glucosidase